jgi:DNA-binding NarL/FixJ family response regulator
VGIDSGLGRLARAWQPTQKASDSLWARLWPSLPSRAKRPGRDGELVLIAAPGVTTAFQAAGRLHAQRRAGRVYVLESTAPDSVEQIEALLAEHAPRVLLIDVELCALMGLSALRSLRRAHPATDWLLGWREPSPRWIETAIHSQAAGAVQWDIDADELTRALDAVVAGEMWFSRRVMQWLYASMLTAARSDAAPSSSLPVESTISGEDLTAREAEVMALMRQGLTNQQIADRLFISINTVKKHLASAFEKRGLRSRRQAT